MHGVVGRICAPAGAAAAGVILGMANRRTFPPRSRNSARLVLAAAGEGRLMAGQVHRSSGA